MLGIRQAYHDCLLAKMRRQAEILFRQEIIVISQDSHHQALTLLARQ